MKNVKFVTTAALIAMFSLSAVSALAQTTSTPRIDQRQANQQKRIDAGTKSGQLTPQEAARLQKGQTRVQKAEGKAMADGKMTAKERARIEKMQDRESKRIARERHDKQRVK